MFRPGAQNNTALDFAGMHQSYESLLVMIEYFSNHFEIVEEIFKVDAKGKPFKTNNPRLGKDNNYPWLLTRVKSSDMSEF